MKRIFAILFAAMLAAQAWAFDFSAVSSSGHTLYYNVTSNTEPYTVEVTCPIWDYSGYDRPTGSMIIPETVTNNGITYSVTSIANEAFRSCLNLESVDIPSTVTAIGLAAFSSCGMTSIDIPVSVEELGPYAFSNCTNLTNITVNPDNAYFSSNDDGVLFNKDKTVIRCCPAGKIGEYTIPGSVTSIGNSAFYGCQFTSITIPNTVTKIDDYAFRECKFTTMTIPNSVTSIGEHAFDYCYDLNSVIIGDGVTRIGNYAFEGCDNLVASAVVNNATYLGNSDNPYYALIKVRSEDITSFEIESGCVVIADEAFCGVNALESVVISNTVKHIGHEAFRNCQKLKSIDIPNSVESIGDYAFYNCSSLAAVEYNPVKTNVENNAFANTPYGESTIEYDDGFLKYSISIGMATVTDYPGDSKSVTIPEKIIVYGKEYPVTGIGDDAFNNSYHLESIIIPNSVKTIGKRAFASCVNMPTVTIPKSVESVGTDAFFDVNNIVLLNDLAGKPWGANSWNMNYHLSDDGKELLEVYFGEHYPEEIYIPYGVEAIANGVFLGFDKLTTVHIPNTVKTIGDYAFYNCSSLAAVEYNPVKTNVENNAFANTPYGESTIEYDDGFLKYSISIGMATVTDYPGDSKSVTIPEKIIVYGKEYPVTGIGDDAFNNSYHLESIIIPNSVKTIGKRAFASCVNMPTVTIPKSVESVGTDAFFDVNNIVLLNDLAGKPWGANSWNMNYHLSDDGKELLEVYFGEHYPEEIYIPYGVEAIANGVFLGFDKLTTVHIPNTVKTIGDYAFYNCDGLTSIDIPASVDSIGNDAFWGCNNIKNLTYNTDAFNPSTIDKTNLETVVIGDAVTSISDNVFSYCGNLKSVTLGNFVETIGNSAFENCNSLSSVSIGNSVETIGDYAFYNCSSLTSIDLPESVTYIGYDAFTGTNVPEEDLKLKNQEGNQNQQNNQNQLVSNGVIYKVVGSTVTVAGYSKDADITNVSIPATVTIDGADYPVTGIGSFAFSNCQTIQSVIVGNTVTSIGQGAFANCHNIRELEISNSVETIGNKAFYGCHKLATVVVPRNAQIGESAFSYVKNVDYYGKSTDAPWGALTLNGFFDDEFIYSDSKMTKITAYIGNSSHVTIPERVTNIGYMSFFESDNLESVRIPNTVKYIGGSAFANCYKLGAVNVPLSVVSVGRSAFRECSDAVIYCEAKSQPSSWNKEWNKSAGKIVWGITDAPVAVIEESALGVLVYTEGRTIVVENATDEIRVYNAMGSLVGRGATGLVRTAITVNVTGVYIVKIGAAVQRVVIK